MLKTTFLEPTAHNAKASKRFYLDDNSQLESEYITGAFFTSHTEEHADLRSMYDSLKVNAANFNALLKGNVTRPLSNERRKGSTNSTDSTNWIVFDVDGLKGVDTAEAFMEKLGYGDLEYIVQYSASSGVNPDKGLSCHIIAQLDTYYPAPVLKEWLKQLNLNNEFLASQISLTKTNAALSWPLDITTCQNDKLIFISPPELGDGVTDNFKGERITYHSGRLLFISPQIAAGTAESNTVSSAHLVARLRDDLGLPKKSFKTVLHTSGVEVLKGVAGVTITGIKQDGDYVRINLNGGDSWAYYHPTTDATILHNFKGEPNYLLKDLDPNYHADARAECVEAKKREAIEKQSVYLQDAKRGVVRTAVRDYKTDKYYTVTWDHGTQTLEAYKILNKDRINDFLVNNDQPEMDYIPDWEVSHDLQSDQQFDPLTRSINLFAAPTGLKKAGHSALFMPPPNSNFLISHMLSHDAESIRRFYNWVAYIVQYRTSPRTAWILHGVQGTGKGVLFSNILAKLFGTAAVKKPYQDFSELYNGQLATSLLVMVDEVSNESWSSSISQKFKTLITESELSVKIKYQDTANATMHAAFIFTSNNTDIYLPEKNDRRYNVPPRQEKTLIQHYLNGAPPTDANLDAAAEKTQKLCDDVLLEADEMAAFLHSYNVNVAQATTPMRSEAKDLLIAASINTTELFCEALRTGDLHYLASFIPASITEQTSSILMMNPLENKYIQVLEAIVKSLVESPIVKLPRDDLQSLYNFIVRGSDQTAAKFTRMLKNNDIQVKQLKVGTKNVQGMAIEFDLTELEIAGLRHQLHGGESPITQVYKERASSHAH